MKKVVNKMKGGSSIKSTMGLDSGFFFLGLFGFIILLVVVMVLALTQEMEVPCSTSFLKPIQMEWRKVWIGGCAGSRWGCCPDSITTKYDAEGSNCVDEGEKVPCDLSLFGCCADGETYKNNFEGTNCP